MPQIHELTTNSSPSNSSYVAVDDGVYTKKATLKSIANVVYPVGAIYMSTNSTSPATLFGGTWTRIQGQFLLAASSTYSAGSTGGSSTNTLTESNLPKITGSIDIRQWGSSGAMIGNASGKFSSSLTSNAANAAGSSSTANYFRRLKYEFGEDSPTGVNNMPPYLAVYVWERTA